MEVAMITASPAQREDDPAVASYATLRGTDSAGHGQCGARTVRGTDFAGLGQCGARTVRGTASARLP
jgi:uncharacterized low-complexity protein